MVSWFELSQILVYYWLTIFDLWKWFLLFVGRIFVEDSIHDEYVARVVSDIFSWKYCEVK